MISVIHAESRSTYGERIRVTRLSEVGLQGVSRHQHGHAPARLFVTEGI